MPEGFLAKSTTCCVLAFVFGMASVSAADELRPFGVLGNSGGDGDTLVNFSGQVSTGLGLVLDAENTLWDRGGSTQLNRYSLDGRLLASFPLPDSPGTRGSDTMTLAGDQLILRIRNWLYRLPLNAEPGTAPERCYQGQVGALSPGSFEGRVVIAEETELSWFDVATGEKTALATSESAPRHIALDADGTVYAFRDDVRAWKDGEPLDGYPIEMRAAYPQKIGDFWYSHGYHGTIRRYNDRFEPVPGVVLGGNSGSFIGFLPESSDLAHGRGLVHIRDDLFAVSGLAGVVQLLRWSKAENRFQVVRRIGALTGINAITLDADGNIWTPRGSWRWNASPETPHALGAPGASAISQPVVVGGQTIALLRNSHNNFSRSHGPAFDANGWTHPKMDHGLDFTFERDTTPGATLIVEEDGRYRMIVARADGSAAEFQVSSAGQISKSPLSTTTLPGLSNCTSLAWFDGYLIAADSGQLVVFERTKDTGWKESSRMTQFGKEAWLHSDGKRLIVADTTNGKVHVYDSLGSRIATREGLAEPRQVAVSGNRAIVLETGRQLLARFELTSETPDSAAAKNVVKIKGSAVPDFSPTEAEFFDVSLPGGLSCSIAIRNLGESTAFVVRTSAADIQVGVATANAAFVAKPNAGRFEIPTADLADLRIAIGLKDRSQQERIGFIDGKAIHAPFDEDHRTWARFDLARYQEIVGERSQEIRLAFEQPLDGNASIVIEDADGRRVRNLVSGESFDEGAHSVVWDGLDESGQLVAPGEYQWRGISHPGIRPEFKTYFADGGEGIDAGGRPWGTNHGLLHHAVSDDQHIYFAAPVTEGGWAIMALDADGNFVQGYEHQQGFGIGHNAIAVDENYLYCAQDGFGWGGTRGVDFTSKDWKATWTLTVARYDLKTGKVVEFPGKRRAFEADTMVVGPGSDHPDLKDYNLGGIAVFKDRIYVGCRSENAVLVFNPENGERVESIAIKGVRHLAAGPESVYAATDSGVVRLSDNKPILRSGIRQNSRRVRNSGESHYNVAGLTVGPNGNLWISDTVSHQVYEYSVDGKRLRTIGKPGGPYRGAYDRNRMVEPAGLAFGPDGKLWVTEKRWNPKRILAWNAKLDSVVYEKFGMPHYGGDGSGFDPENPRRWIGLGCFWDVDVETGKSRPTHIFSDDEAHFEKYHPHSYSFFRDAGRTFLIARGKIALISEVFEDGTIRDIAAACGTHHFAYGCGWKPPQAYIDAFYEKWPEKRAEERPGRGPAGKPWAGRVAGVLWVDRNADGLPQKDEFSFTEDNVRFADGAWGHMQNSLTYRFPAAIDDQVMIVEIKPRGFLENGIPDYPALQEAVDNNRTNIDLTTGYNRQGVATSGDQFGRFILLSDPEMNAYDKYGRHLWDYPNQWSNVHGSHKAPLPETGVIQGAMAILGMAEFDDQADVFFINGNHGRCFLLTSDGLYLDEAFTDVRVSYAKNTLRLGGEIFGGTFNRSATDGSYYVQIGHGPYRIYQLHGIDKAVRMSGTIRVSSEQIVSAEQRNLRRFAEQQRESRKTLTIPGTISWDRSGKFKTSVTAKFEDDHLRLVYQVQDASPWVNNGRDWTTLFATGDSVDLQIGVDSNASPDRRKPVDGDQRLLIAPFEDTSIAVLYQHRRMEGKDLNPIEFTSPWRGEKVNHVARLTDAEIKVTRKTGSYIVDIRVPRASLGLDANNVTLKADFGVTFGDAEGTETQLRSYWANPATMLVDDIPGEIMLHPNLWGEVRVK